MWQRKPTMRSKTMEPSFTCKFSPDDRILLSGHFDGTIVGYDTSTGSNKFEWNVTPRETRGKIPVTSLAFRPGGGKPILLVGCSNGCVDRWDLRTLEKTTSHREADNEVYAVDYRSDGSVYATAGRDTKLRIYDDQSNQIIHTFETVGESMNPAAARLYSVNFPKDDPNLVCVAGWSKTIFIFDMRMDGEAGTVQQKQELFGPYIGGDALSSSADSFLTASHRLDQRLQLWDRSNLGEVSEIAWPSKNEFMPCCAKFSNDANGEFFAVGGATGSSNGQDTVAKDGAFVYDRKHSKLVVDATFDKGINCCAFGHRSDLGMVAFGDGDGQMHMFEMVKGEKK